MYNRNNVDCEVKLTIDQTKASLFIIYMHIFIICNLGSLFAGIAFCENICIMVGSAAAGAMYSATVDVFSGFAFLVMAGYNVVALVLLL